MTHDEDGPPTVYEQVAVLRRRVTLLTEELKRAMDERDEARVDLALATTGAAPVGVYARLAAVEAERDTLRTLLREVEWRCVIASISATQDDVFVNTTLVAACPLCYNTQTEGHKSDCRLHAALEEHNG